MRLSKAETWPTLRCLRRTETARSIPHLRPAKCAACITMAAAGGQRPSKCSSTGSVQRPAVIALSISRILDCSSRFRGDSTGRGLERGRGGSARAQFRRNPDVGVRVALDRRLMGVSVADPSCCKPASECALQFWSAPTPISELQLSGCYGTKCPIARPISATLV
jgi:hypothetical protein